MANQGGVPALLASRRYVLMYRARAMNTIRKLYPCSTYRGADPCCLEANSWADPCISYPVKIRCVGCNHDMIIRLSLRHCPQYCPPPLLSPEEPVQHHYLLACGPCNFEGTIVILRVCDQPLEADNEAKSYMEIQLQGPFRVVVGELLGGLQMGILGRGFFTFCCQGPATKPPQTLYQGMIDLASYVDNEGYTIKFNRLKVEGVPLQVEGFDGFWAEGFWRADEWFETFGLNVQNNFTGTQPGWPPTAQDFIEYYNNNQDNYSERYSEFVVSNLML